MIRFYPPPPMIAFNTDYEDTVSRIHRAWNQHVHDTFLNAILQASGGSIPSDEELAQWCQTVIAKDGTHYLLWKAPEYKLGEPVDLSYAIAAVKAPQFGKPIIDV